MLNVVLGPYTIQGHCTSSALLINFCKISVIVNVLGTQFFGHRFPFSASLCESVAITLQLFEDV